VASFLTAIDTVTRRAFFPVEDAESRPNLSQQETVYETSQKAMLDVRLLDAPLPRITRATHPEYVPAHDARRLLGNPYPKFRPGGETSA
jgi:hypothetical protein